MRKNATEVLNAWINGNAKGGETIWTDGTTVYSYRMPIAHRVGKRVFFTRENPTRTTGSHMTAVDVFLGRESGLETYKVSADDVKRAISNPEELIIELVDIPAAA